MRFISYRKHAIISVVALAMALAPGCASRAVHQDPTTGRLQPDIDQGGVSPEEEIKVGRQAAQQVAQQMPVLPDNNPVTQYVKQLGQKLAAKAPGYKYPYNFHVINQKEINAFALPGGEIFINLGTIQKADESELAGVMAHEITHVAMRHSVREAQKAQWIQLPAAILGGVLGGGGSMGGQLAQLGIALGANGIIAKYSRTAETEADLVGSQIMYDAGYDPYSMVEFFQILEKEGGSGGGPQFLSDHPDPGNRAQTVAEAIKSFPKKQYQRSDSPQFVAMKRTADSMKPLTAQQIAQQQKSRAPSQVSMPMPNPSDVMPSGSTKDLNSQLFRIKYPGNWEVVGNQDGSSTTIGPRAGISQDAIAYGVVINAVSAPQRQASLDEVTQAILQQLGQSNPDMKQAGNAQRVNVNGAPAIVVPVTSTSPLRTSGGQQVRERDLIVTVQRPDNSILLLVFVAPEQDFSRLQPTYESMLNTLQVQ
jgi:beta-barrel assembly-enhancing protease